MPETTTDGNPGAQPPPSTSEDHSRSPDTLPPPHVLEQQEQRWQQQQQPAPGPAPAPAVPGQPQPQNSAPPALDQQPPPPPSSAVPGSGSDQPQPTTVNNPSSVAEPRRTDGQPPPTPPSSASPAPETTTITPEPSQTPSSGQPPKTPPPPLTSREAHEILQAHAQNPDAQLSDLEAQRLDQARRTRAAAIKKNLDRKLEVTQKPLPPAEAKALADANTTLSQPPPGRTNINTSNRTDANADPNGNTNTHNGATTNTNDGGKKDNTNPTSDSNSKTDPDANGSPNPQANTNTEGDTHPDAKADASNNPNADTKPNAETNANGDTNPQNAANTNGNPNSAPKAAQQRPPPPSRTGPGKPPTTSLPGQPPRTTISNNSQPSPPSSRQSQPGPRSGFPSAHGTSTSNTRQPAFPKASASTDDGNGTPPNPSGESSPSTEAKTFDQRRRENAQIAADRPRRRHPFSNNVTVTEKDLHGQILRKVTLLTDYVHDDGSSKPVVLDDRVEEKDHNGEYLPNHAGVRRGIDAPLMTGAHELGHHIALHSLSPEAVLRIHDVARDTPTWERIIKRNHKLKYWTDPEEVFCRAYAQFVAVRSGDPEMLAELSSTLNNRFRKFTQWPPSEFARIHKALEQEFKKIGWL